MRFINEKRQLPRDCTLKNKILMQLGKNNIQLTQRRSPLLQNILVVLELLDL